MMAGICKTMKVTGIIPALQLLLGI